MPIAAGARRALRWVFCGSSPWFDSNLANSSDVGAGPLCVGRKAVGIAGASFEGVGYAVARTGFDCCRRPAVDAKGDAEDGVQAIAPKVSNAQAGAISREDSTATSRSGDLK